MKLNVKTARFLATGVMVLIMTFVVVFVSTILNFGWDESFVLRFLRGWGLAFLLAFPLVLFLMPRLHKVFQSRIREEE